jgi:uncharacterized protein
MRLRNENHRIGHLLSFISKKNREDNFSFFFPVQSIEQFDSLLELTKGFERCLENYRNEYEFRDYSIADFGQMDGIFPEMDIERVSIFEQEEFITKESEFMEDLGKVVLARYIQGKVPVFPGIVTGSMAAGSDFYDRRDKISTIWDRLEKGENILLRAPRRYGKSSLLNHLTRYPKVGWQVCFVDLEGGKSPEDFVEYILKMGMLQNESCTNCLPERLFAQNIHDMSEMEKLDIIRAERSKINSNWQAYAEELFESIEQKSGEKRFLLILDEISFLVEDMLETGNDSPDKVQGLLKWFHDIRNKTGKTQFIISGSEHLPTFLQGFQIDGFIDDLEQEHLDLFDEKTSRELVFLMLAGLKIVVENGEIEQILNLIGDPIPYFLQLFLDVIIRTCKAKQRLSSDEIEEIYYRELLGSSSKRHFESIVKQLERYKRYGDSYRTGAERLLNQLAIKESIPLDTLKVIWQEATGSEKGFKLIIEIMQDDFYIKEETDGTLFFGSKLLRDWWEKHRLSGMR